MASPSKPCPHTGPLCAVRTPCLWFKPPEKRACGGLRLALLERAVEGGVGLLAPLLELEDGNAELAGEEFHVLPAQQVQNDLALARDAPALTWRQRAEFRRRHGAGAEAGTGGAWPVDRFDAVTPVWNSHGHGDCDSVLPGLGGWDMAAMAITRDEHDAASRRRSRSTPAASRSNSVGRTRQGAASRAP